MSLTWCDPADERPKRKPQADLPLFECAVEAPLQGHEAAGSGADNGKVVVTSRSASEAHARRSDPATSHQAAASVTNLGETRELILKILKMYGPQTDEQIWNEYEDWRHLSWHDMKRVSPSGLRSRRAELVRLGFVEDSGHTGRTAAGRSTTIWRICK